MKFIATCFYLIIFAFTISAQTQTQILAKANGQNFTSADLPEEVREAFLNLSKNSIEARKLLFNQQIAEILLDTEAKVRKVSVDKLIETQVDATVANPSRKTFKPFMMPIVPRLVSKLWSKFVRKSSHFCAANLSRKP